MKVTTCEYKLKEIASACGAELFGDPESVVTGFATDSREVTPGSAFLAIRGENSDGCDYIKSAFENGATCVICPRASDDIISRGNVLVVDDTVKALARIADRHRQSLSVRTVAVTGSVGKTTTKDFIYSVLSQKYKTFRTQGNHNNEIGLPMSLLSLDRSYGAAVVEMGMSAAGEISALSKMARPEVAVITNIGSMHIEYLGSREAIRDAKMEIRNGMKAGGILILNGDEPLLANVPGAFYVSDANTDSDLRISNVIEGDNGSCFDLVIGRERVESIVIPTFGRHNIFNAAFAWAVGVQFGIGEFEMRRGLMEFRHGEMRQDMYVQSGMTFIEDCYNAGPESMAAALKVLSGVAERGNRRSVAVLGEMKELGGFSGELHGKVGQLVAKENIGILVTVGDGAKPLSDAAIECGMKPANVIHISSEVCYNDAARIIAGYLIKGDVVLFKASRSLRFETLVSSLKAVLS